MSTARHRSPARAIPSAHRARSHPELLRALGNSVKAAFESAERPWDPRRDRLEAPDPGRGLLDCYALPLHILWTYQDAWAREGFQPTLRLDSSRARLIELVAPPPTPGLAAVGLQHFRCRAGRETTVPRGFRLTAPARDGRKGAQFETLTAARISHARNSFLPFLPGAARPIPSEGTIAITAELLEPDVLMPAPGVPLLPQLEARVAAGNQGATARRNAARQRVRALQRAETLQELQDTGLIDPFSPAFQSLCAEVCAAQALANEVPPTDVGAPLSEAQEILLVQLGKLARQQPEAMSGFEEALGRRPEETDAEWTRRLDQTTGFLDSLVTGLLQQARDSMARLHGPAHFDRLDRAMRGAEGNAIDPPRGFADTGTDSLFLLSTLGGPETGDQTQVTHVEPGDWLVVEETTRFVDPNGEIVEDRKYREALEVTKVRDEVPEGRTAPMTRVTFRPGLQRGYRLSNVRLLGNMVPVSHGSTVRRTVTRAQVRGAGLVLTDDPLTWLPDPLAREGRKSAVSLRISGQTWTQVQRSDIADAPPGAFFLSVGADGTARLAIGKGDIDAPIAADASIEIAYRTGSGADGNRPANTVTELASANSAIASTFNPLPMTGGIEPETSVEALEAGIGASILDRAVSIADLRRLVHAYGSVRQASVFRFKGPQSAKSSTRRLVIVVSGQAAAPLASEELAALHDYLAARVPPGVTFTLENRQIVEVVARIRLAIAPGGEPLKATAEARSRLGVTSGETPGLLHPDASCLGRAVALSDLHRALDGVPGVSWIHVEALHRVDRPVRRADRIAIGHRELPLWAGAAAGGEPVEIVWEHLRDLR